MACCVDTCVVVNTLENKEADRLLVKLDNFGLARLYDHPWTICLKVST